MTSLLLSVLFLFLVAIAAGERFIVFLVKTLMSEDEMYQMYNLAMFTILFTTMFIATAATYNTFIKH
jgi:hypothetical protein